VIAGKKAFGDLGVGLTSCDQTAHFLPRRAQLQERIPAVIFIKINHFMDMYEELFLHSLTFLM
jgi:hypothetical protein